MRPALNLARRPFRNERLPALLLAAAAVAVLLLTARHALELRRLTTARGSAAEQELGRLEQRRQALLAEAGRLKAPDPPPDEVARWTSLRNLVDQRSFSWTGLLACLEDVLPADVRLVSIAPAPRRSGFRIQLVAVGRTDEAALAFMGRLEKRPEFTEVYPEGLATVADGSELRLSVRYLRPAAPASAPAGGHEKEAAGS